MFLSSLVTQSYEETTRQQISPSPVSSPQQETLCPDHSLPCHQQQWDQRHGDWHQLFTADQRSETSAGPGVPVQQELHSLDTT